MFTRIVPPCVLLAAAGALCGCQSSLAPVAASDASAPPPITDSQDAGEDQPVQESDSGSEWLKYLRRYPYDRVPSGALQVAREEKARMSAAPAEGAARRQAVSGDAWRPIGPRPIETAWSPVSGRVRAVAIDQSDPSLGTYYVGGASGGVWKTTNGGRSWIPLTDGEASLATGSIAIDPDDASIVYVGTGEAGGAYEGAGVLRSTNGGISWTRLGAAEFNGQRIARIALDPSTIASPLTSRTVYVASTNGLFRSQDSGASWTPVWTAETSRVFTDVVVDPTNPAFVFAARQSPDSNAPHPPVYLSDSHGDPGTWNPVPGIAGGHQLPQLGYGRVNLAISSTSPPVLMVSMRDNRNGRDLKGIWISSDRGLTWERVNGHPPEFGEASLVAVPDDFEVEGNDSILAAQQIILGDVVQGSLSSGTDVDFYRVHLDGNELSFEICADRLGSGFVPQLSLFDQGGGALIGSPLQSDPGKGPQGSRDVRMSTAWTTFPPGDYYVKVGSSDGTLSGSGVYQLSVIGASLWCQCDYDQVDFIHPSDPDTMYFGGIRLFRTTDGGRNWSQIQDHEDPAKGPNWVHQDIHGVDVAASDPEFMLWGSDGGVFATLDGGDKWLSLNTNLELTQFYTGIAQYPGDPDFVIGGTQDNGTLRYRGTGWELPVGTGGDGGYTAVDPGDATEKTWYFATPGVVVTKTTDDGVTSHEVISGLDRDSVARNGPFILDPANSNVLLAGGGKLVSTNPDQYEHYVYRTTNGGSSWTKNSVDLGAIINALAFAPSSSATYYAGTTAGTVWLTTNTGANWNDRSTGLPNRPITSIAVHPTNPDIAWVTLGSFNTGHVYQTVNGGTSWSDVSSAPWSATALPNAPTWRIVVDPSSPGTLYVASDVGIFKSTDDGIHWTTFDDHLPNVPVYDLHIDAAAGTMRAATFGRSMWELTQGNDACLDADPVTDGTVYSSTTGTANDGGASCGSSSSSPDVWYKYTAPFTGELHVDTCGSELDTVLSVHQNGCPADDSTELSGGCNDDCAEALPGCDNRDSCVAVPMSAGSQYLIRVAGYNGAEGDFALTVDGRRPAPTNDACGSVYLPHTGSYHGWSTGATNDGSSSCGFSDSSPDVWYRYTAECTGQLTASLCGADFDTVLSVHSGCPGSPENEYLCNDDCGGDPCSGHASCVSLPAVQGTDYYLRVAGYFGDTGEYDLTIGCMPGNDSCANPWGLTDGDSSFTTVGATTDGPDGDPLCDNSGTSNLTNDVWYVYEPSCDGHVTIATCDADFDTRIAVYDGAGCPSGPSSIACDDDSCGAPGFVQSQLTFDGLRGHNYTVRVGGYNGATGQGTITVATVCSAIFADDFESGGLAHWSSHVP